MFSKSSRTNIRHTLRKLRRQHGAPLLKIAAAVFLAYGFFFLWATPWGRSFDIWQTRQLFSLRGPRAMPDDILLVAIDDLSFHELGASPRWPFPRAHFASALETLVDAQPRLVILDLAGLPESEDEAANERIASALSKLPVTIAKGFFPLTYGHEQKEIVMLTDERFRDAATLALEMHLEAEQGVVWFLGKPSEMEASYTRHFPLASPLKEVAGYNNMQPQSPYSLINFYGPPGTVPRITIADLILKKDELKLNERLKNKVVLLGFQSITRMRGQLNQEEFPVAVSSVPMFGVEIFAHIAGNFIDNSPIRRLAPGAEGQLLLMLSAIVFFCILAQGFWSAWIISLSIWGIYSALSYWLFIHKQFFLPGATLLILTILVLIGPVSVYRALKEKMTLRLIKKRLGIEE